MIDLKNAGKISVILFTIFFLSSCASIYKGKESGPAQGTLVVYLHLLAEKPIDIFFKIEGIEIERKEKEWIKLSEKKIGIRSLDMAGDQILLVESSVPEGKYKGLKIRFSEASVRKEKQFYNLALPQPGGEVVIAAPFDLGFGESRALFLEWEPNESITDNYLFKPAISVKPQEVSPRTLLLYVANSGSNYLSVIDRFENRVVGIISVDKRPTKLVLSLDEERLYVLNSGSNTISIIDTTQDYVREKIQLISGINPVEMAMIPDTQNRNHGKLYITNRGSNDVTVLDTFMKSQVRSIKVGNGPTGITANPERQEVYVANTGSNSVSIIDSLTQTVKATVNVDTRPQDILIVENSLYVLNSGSDRIVVIDVISKEITRTIPAGIGPRKGLYSKKHNRIYIANYGSGQVSFLIPSTSAIIKSVEVGQNPIGLAIGESRNRLYVTNFSSNTVTVVDQISELVEKTITVGRNPYDAVSIK